MERGPLPPHERTWRHPSELAAEERSLLSAEAAPRHARLLAITTGTVGLLAVGLVLVTITPRRTEGPIAISATTTAIALAPVPGAAESAAPARDSSSPSEVRPVGLAPGPTVRSAAPPIAPPVLATPLGDGRFALVTRAALASDTHDVVEVRLPSGRDSVGEIVTASEHAVVVALADVEPGHAVALHRPDDDDIVTVMASPPVEVVYAEAHMVAADEGAAVLDAGGDLVGLCTQSGTDSAHVIEIVAELDDATSVVP